MHHVFAFLYLFLCTFFSTVAVASASSSFLRRSLEHIQNIMEIDLETCELASSSNFHIQLVDMGDTPANDSFQQAFELAAQRWQAVIIGDLTGFAKGYTTDWFGGTFSKAYDEAVDDVVIGYELRSIDGIGGTLGQAGPTRTRSTGPNKSTTVSGIMIFDLDDFENMPLADAQTVSKDNVLLYCICHCFELYSQSDVLLFQRLFYTR